MKPVQAVFFDIDDTLLDFDAYCRDAMRTGFAFYGLGSCSEEMYEVFRTVNRTLWQEIEQNTLDFKTLQQVRWNRVFEQLGISFDGTVFETYFREQLFESTIEVEGAREVLAFVSRHYPVYAASNGPYGQQVNRLQKAGMLDFFSGLFISEKMGVSKPAAAFFDRAFDQLETELAAPVQRERCVLIGDSLTSDIKGARAAGMRAILFDRAGTYRPEEDRCASDSDTDHIPAAGHGRPAGFAAEAVPDAVIRKLVELQTLL